MKQHKPFGKLKFDDTPPTEGRKKAEAELLAFREAKRRRRAESSTSIRETASQKA